MNGNNDGITVERSVDGLRSMVTLPVTPAEVWFEQVPVGSSGGLGPADYILVAVMRFEPADIERITATSQRRPGSPPRLSITADRPWFPEPIKAAIHPYDDRSVTIMGDKFDAAHFTKSPLLSGTFIAVEGGRYIILVLQTS